MLSCRVASPVAIVQVGYIFFPAPSPPSGVRAAQNGPGSVQVSWRAASGPVIKYVIYYRQQMEIDAPATEATITGLIVGATYSIRMVAKSRTLPSNVTSPLYATIGTLISLILLDCMLLQIQSQPPSLLPPPLPPSRLVMLSLSPAPSHSQVELLALQTLSGRGLE